jgi:hypothetical protein
MMALARRHDALSLMPDLDAARTQAEPVAQCAR